VNGWEGEEATSRSLIYHVYLICRLKLLLALTNVLGISKKVQRARERERGRLREAVVLGSDSRGRGTGNSWER